MSNKYTSTKEFFDYPCSHRQWKHEGHCKFVHGYSRSFKFWFKCDELNECGFVADFSMFKPLKEHLTHMFDHTLLLNSDDPHLKTFELLNELKVFQLRVMENVSMEGTSKYLLEKANDLIKQFHSRELERGLKCFKVETRENRKNAANYEA